MTKFSMSELDSTLLAQRLIVFAVISSWVSYFALSILGYYS